MFREIYFPRIVFMPGIIMALWQRDAGVKRKGPSGIYCELEVLKTIVGELDDQTPCVPSLI